MTGIWLISYLALWILVVIVAVVLLLMVRSLSIVVEKLQALQAAPEPATTLSVGETLPDVALRARDGMLHAIHRFRGADTAVVIITPGCGPCRDVLAEVSQHPNAPDPLHLHVFQTVLICIGDMNEAEQELTQAGVPATVPVFFDSDNKVQSSWGIHGTPTMIILSPDFQVVRASAGFMRLGT
jgi:hypothetical protein